MAVDIEATGFVGIAFEATAGTYVAPTKFFPISSENLKLVQDKMFRRLIRGIADELGAVKQYSRVEGTIEMECLHTVLPYFLHASRNTVGKTGTNPYVYTTTPFHSGVPTATRTLSITVVRNGMAFGYVGCVVSSMSITTNDGVAMLSVDIVGRDEATQSVPSSPTYDTTTPFGPGMYTIGNPTGSTVTDVDTFNFQANDNAQAVNRLASVTTPQVILFGQREVTLSMTRDFQDRTEYDAFKALTARSVRITMTSGANIVQLTLPVTIKDTYEIGGLSDQGEVVTAEINYKGEYDTATSKSYEFVVTTTENIT